MSSKYVISVNNHRWGSVNNEEATVEITGIEGHATYGFFSSTLMAFFLDQAPFCWTTDYPCFGLRVTLPIGFGARVVLWCAILLASLHMVILGSWDHNLVLHLAFLPIGVYSVLRV